MPEELKLSRIVSVRLSNEELELLDRLAKAMRVENRSDVIRELIRSCGRKLLSRVEASREYEYMTT